MKETEKQLDKFDYVMQNFRKVQQSGISKFDKIDTWLEKESQLYKSEIKVKQRNYIHLKRGTIVKVNFGVNPGSELCHTHFAIVLSKYDNIRQETITVLPLTSKPGVGRLPLNNLIKKEILNMIKKKGLSSENENEIFELLNEYKKYKDFAYAYISQVTTISKSRLIYPKNKFDIINKAKCSAEILDKIDNEIIESFTGKTTIKLAKSNDLVIN